MTRLTTEVATFFTEVQAIRCCQALAAEGIESRFEGPPKSGNVYVDWNMPVCNIAVFIAEEDLEAAEKILAEIEFPDEPMFQPLGDLSKESEAIEAEAGVPYDFEVPEMEDEVLVLSAEDQISKEAVQARNAAILSLVMACLIPVALYLIIRVSSKPLSPKDRRNLDIGLVCVVLSTAILVANLSLPYWLQ